jgi:hypothetical protein
MGLWDKLKQAGDYLRRLRLSRGPDSYFRYRRERDYERKQAERARADSRASSQAERAEAERGREYAERYRREREGDG